MVSNETTKPSSFAFSFLFQNEEKTEDGSIYIFPRYIAGVIQTYSRLASIVYK